jgi:hypothetical protein
MSDTPMQPAAATLSAIGIASALAISLVITPVAGALSLGTGTPALTSATSTVITPTVGAVTLGGVAPTFTKPTVSGFTPTVGSITLAGVASTVAQAIGAVTSFEQIGQSTVVWAGIGNGQAGTFAPKTPGYGKVFVQVTGTFGSGGSIELDGSNDGFNWVKLSSAALTSAGFFAALGANEKPKYIRPNCTAGDATTSLNITAWFST